MVVLQIEQTSASTGNLLFFKLALRYAGVNYWKPVFVNDNGEIQYSWINMVANSWHVDVGMGTSNTDMKQVIRFIVNNAAGTNKGFLNMSEPWDFTQDLKVRLFALDTVSSWYFNGAIGRIDYVGGYFSTSSSTTNEENTMEQKLPSIEYWLDFQDPMFSQYFKNRANNSYLPAINGYSNHSDFQDVQFDFKEGWVMRKNMMLIQLPLFKWNEDMDINNIWYFKLKFRRVNHWSQQGEPYRFYHYGNPASPYFQVYIYKWDYGTPVRVRTIYPGQGDWDTCYYTISPANEVGESPETAYGQAVFRPPYARTVISYRYTCSIAGLSAYRALSAGYSNVPNPVISFGGTDVFHQQEPGIPTSSHNVYPRNPFLQPSNFGNTNRSPAMIQFILREFVFTTGAAHTSSAVMPSANNCKPNTQMLLGFDIVDMPLACSGGFKNYHEVAMCIADPLIAGSTECSHDMISTQSNCFRCPRGYGQSGTDACSQCAPNCLKCTGPNTDQCTYCGLGYGFTGVSCLKCSADQTWDLTKNLCQLKKALYLEINYDQGSFGLVQLLFLPLGGYADLSLYYEYMYEKIWLVDINYNYEFSRRYTNLPLHRKVSISFEFMCIDTRSFDPLAWSVDSIYLGFLNWALEDQGMNVTAPSVWGYGYQDQLPTKYAHTLLHSASSMNFIVKPYFGADWQTIWIRELNVTFFGCFESCKTCWEDNSPVNCLSCLDGYYFTNFQCKACSASCRTCSDTPFKCTSCLLSQKLLGGSCISACGLGYFSDVSNTCQLCPSTCVQCNSLTNCISCINGYYLDGSNMCSSCDNTQCQNCIGTPTTCTSCQMGFLLQSGTCIDATLGCSAGYYQVGMTTCQACPTGCASCDISACLSCLPGHIPKGTICSLSTECGSGWYNAGTSCNQCLDVCQTCTTGTSCTTCKPGFVTTSCIPCVSPCLTCSGSATSCTSCDPNSGKYLQFGGGSCVSANQCLAGSYAETNNRCMPCSTDCGTCQDSQDKCLSCASASKTWKNFQCISGCGTGLTAIGGLCCPEACTSCDMYMACSGCITGYFKDQSKNCIKCDANCLTCLGSTTKCTTCRPGMVLQGSVCQPACKVGFYLDSFTCKACHSTCSTCTGSLNTECTSCAAFHVPWKKLCWSCLNSQQANGDSRFELKGGRCWEKCGIAGKLTIDEISEGLGGYKACDDGNQKNGDGCSSSCVIEKNFNCVGGSQTKPDYCYPLIKPTAQIYPINNSTEFQIIFSNKIQFRNISDPTNNTNIPVPISIDIAGIANSSFSIQWSKSSTKEFDYINFTIVTPTTILLKRLTVTFDRSLIVDMYNNSLATVRLKANTTIIVDKSFFFESAYSSLQLTSKIFNAIIPISSLGVTNFIMQNFIRYMTTFQIIGVGVLYNVNQTSTISNLLKRASVITSKTLPGPAELMRSKLVVYNDSVALPSYIKTYLNRLLAESSSSSQKATNSSTFSMLYDQSDAPLPLQRNGYTGSLIPNLSFSIMVILIMGIWYLMASYCFLGKVTIRDGFLKKFVAFGAERSFYSALMLGALELSFFSTYNALNPKFDHIANMLSFAASVMSLICVLSLPALIYRMADQHPIELWHPEYYERFGFLYCEFKFSSTQKKCFMAIILGRIVILGFIAAAFINYPITQTTALFVLHAIYWVTFLRVRPFVSTTMHLITFLAESSILGSALCFMISAIDNQRNLLPQSKIELLDMINCFLIMSAVICTLIGAFMMILLKIIQFIKKSVAGKKLLRIMPQNPAKRSLAETNPENQLIKEEVQRPKPSSELIQEVRVIGDKDKKEMHKEIPLSQNLPLQIEMESKKAGNQAKSEPTEMKLNVFRTASKDSNHLVIENKVPNSRFSASKPGINKKEFEEDLFGNANQNVKQQPMKVSTTNKQAMANDSDNDRF